jgi:hypothetical protein
MTFDAIMKAEIKSRWPDEPRATGTLFLIVAAIAEQ